MENSNINEYIQNVINNNKVVLFMKGTKELPLCGFSSQVAKILDYLNVDYKDVNVLESADLRQAIKDYSDWPTIPQLYINQEFIGGCDIVTEMFQSNELQELLNS